MRARTRRLPVSRRPRAGPPTARCRDSTRMEAAESSAAIPTTAATRSPRAATNTATPARLNSTLTGRTTDDRRGLGPCSTSQ